MNREEILRESRISSEINPVGSNFPYVDMIKNITFDNGKFVTYKLEDIVFDWTNPELALYIIPMRTFSSNPDISKIKTSRFMLDCLIPYERRNDAHFLYMRFFGEMCSHWKRFRISFEYTFVDKIYVERMSKRIERYKNLLMEENEEYILSELENSPVYKMESFLSSDDEEN